MQNVRKVYYQHSIWTDDKEWIISDKETFNKEVINHRRLYEKKYDFRGKNRYIEYFNNKENSAYDWKVEHIRKDKND